MSDQMQKIVDALESGLEWVGQYMDHFDCDPDDPTMDVCKAHKLIEAALAEARAAPAAEPVVRIIREKDGSLTAKWGPGYIPTEGDRLFLAPPPVKASQQQADWPECSGDPMSCPENEGYGCCKPNRSASQQQCPCGDRPATECPGEWEPGCDLGANEEFARRVAEPASGKKADPTPDYWVLEDEYHIVAVDQEPSTPGISWTPVWREPPTVYAELSRLAAELSAAKAEAEAMRKDAERWRWAATPGNATLYLHKNLTETVSFACRKRLSAEVDRLIAAQQGEKS